MYQRKFAQGLIMCFLEIGFINFYYFLTLKRLNRSGPIIYGSLLGFPTGWKNRCAQILHFVRTFFHSPQIFKFFTLPMCKKNEIC